MGSTSASMSAIVTSGVASFSTNRASRSSQVIGMDFASRDVRNFRIEEVHKPTKNPALGLAAQSEQDEIVPCKNCVGDLRQNGFLVAMNAREERLVHFEPAQHICAQFVLDGAVRRTR